MIAQPETKSNQIVDELSRFINDKVTPDMFTLARLRRDAENIKKKAPNEGYMLLGMIACLEVNLSKCKENHQKSIRLATSALDYMNYSKSLAYLGATGEAYKQITLALKHYPPTPDLLWSACESALGSGFWQGVEMHYQEYKKLSTNAGYKEIDELRRDADYFAQAKVPVSASMSMIDTSDKLIIENNFLIESKNFFLDDTESTLLVCCFIGVYADVDEVVSLNLALCEKLSELPPQDGEQLFSIIFRCA